MVDYKIVISNLTHKTLKQNINFLKNFSISYALSIESCIRKSILKLKLFPNINPIYKKTNLCVYRKLIVKKRYNIIYTVIKDTIYVFYIYDGKQSHDIHFKSLK